VSETGKERIQELKAQVEDLKAAVRDAQSKVTVAKGQSIPGDKGYWRRVNDAKDVHNKCLKRLADAKADLAKVAGTTGSDPRWALISGAWRLLQRLEDGGVDLGEDGRKLLDDIEFHIPMAKLTQP
jgi:hypothetical protein